MFGINDYPSMVRIVIDNAFGACGASGLRCFVKKQFHGRWFLGWFPGFEHK
jgi:hypothetical protein